MEDPGFEISVPNRSVLINPEDVFEGLTLRGSIENIWAPQAEALKAWHAARTRADAQIKMNTGGGKTLVGLLIGQSLVNETRGKVLYLCPTNQLVEQTAVIAEACGMPIATLMQGSWQHQDIFNESRGVCVTNYAAAFTAGSRFADANISAVIFDDAHVAENAIRSQFTLTLNSTHAAFQPICDQFAKYFARSGLANRLSEARQGYWRALLFVPTFEVLRAEPVLRDLLLKAHIDTEKETKFAWRHLKDNLDRCLILISGSGIEITPPILPLHQHFAFKPGVRRVYLTASLPSPSEFVKVFGAKDLEAVTPGGKSGDAQRLFVFVPGEDDEAQRKAAGQLIKHLKACIIVPSGNAAERWTDCATKFENTEGHNAIRNFAQAQDERKLILAARYDGIDLPGDACRVLLIDGLPQGTGLINRFFDETLAIAPLRSMRTATRLVQAIGRIFRSNTDHGVVLLCGTELQRWIIDPNNQAFLPPLLQRQIQLGHQLRKSVEAGKGNYPAAIDGILNGESWWDKLYQSHIDKFDIETMPTAPPWLVQAAERERAAYGLLWDNQFGEAAAMYASLADDLWEKDARLSAYVRHWQGLALDRDGQRVEAAVAFTHAANIRAELGRPEIDEGKIFRGSAAPRPTPQAHRMVRVSQNLGARVFEELNVIATRLVCGPETNQAEAAMQQLGNLLGLDTDRPDNRIGTGPDVIWRDPDRKSSASLEVKTDKKSGSMYTKKDDIGQYQDHAKYVADTYPEDKVLHRIVGPHLPVSPECHPPDGLRIMQPDAFQLILPRLNTLYRALAESVGAEAQEVLAQRWIDHLGLRWPMVLSALPAELATDLQRSEPDKS